MKEQLFVRNVRAAELLELFFVSAVVTLLVIRGYLFLADYPQIGGDTLHIAHVLWGGLSLTSAVLLAISSLGYRALYTAAILGGIGFGTFIDELGKFITADNDYFYQPAAVLIYLSFTALFFAIRWLARKSPLTHKEAVMNALVQMEEVIDHELDPLERERLQDLLDRADDTPLTRKLREVLKAAEASPSALPPLGVRLLHQVRQRYLTIVAVPAVTRAIEILFVAQAAFFLTLTILALYDRLIMGVNPLQIAFILNVAELAVSIVTTGLVLYGAIRIWSSRLSAYEVFHWALLIDILLTQVFVFYREQFSAVFGLVFKLALLGALRFMMRAEQAERAATAGRARKRRRSWFGLRAG